MRVVHIDLGSGWRGGQQQVLMLARHLAQRGVEQTVIARDPLIARMYAAHGLPVLAPSPRAWSAARAALLLHAHDGRAHTWMSLAGALLRARQVLTRRVAFPIRGALSPFLYRRLDAAIAVSESVRRLILATGIEPRRVRVVADGVELATLPEPAAARRRVRQALGIDDAEFCVSCVSALSPEKGVPDLLAALARLPGNVRALLAAEGPLAPELRAQSSAAQLGAARVHFLPISPALETEPAASSAHFTAPELVAAGDVFVLPSRAEGLGSSILLAWALGRPAVASAVGGVPELIRGGETGLLVEPGSPAALAESIQRLRSDAGLRSQLTRAGEILARSQYTAERMADATLAVYQEVLHTEGERV